MASDAARAVASDDLPLPEAPWTTIRSGPVPVADEVDIRAAYKAWPFTEGFVKITDYEILRALETALISR